MPETQLIGQDGLVVRDSGRWVEEKHYYLGRYLKIFSVGMRRKWADKLYYVDLFAGPGRCLIRGTQKEVDGSPLIALLGFNFAKYFFFEADPVCYDALDQRVKKRAPQKVQDVKIIPGDCNEKIDQLAPPDPGLGVTFIDPTDVSPLAFATIRKLTTSRQIDLIINFHEGMGVRMNIHQYTKREGSALDTFMGSSRWREKFQKAPASIDQVSAEITEEYRENLGGLGYRVIPGDQVPVRTERNVLLYYLLFASKHDRGSYFWREIGAIDPHGQRRLPGF